MYFAEAEGKLQRRSLAGGEPEDVSGTEVDTLVAHDDGWLAWANPTYLYAQGPKAKKPAVVAKRAKVYGLGLDDRDVYFLVEVRGRECVVHS